MYLYGTSHQSLRLSSPLPQVPLDDDCSSGYAFVVSESSIHQAAPVHQYDHRVDVLQAPPRNKALTFSNSDTAPTRRTRHDGLEDVSAPRMLGTLSVVAITFFFGCGGPLGSESLISIGGPLTALLAIIIYPIVFTFPYGAVVAELCTAFPDDGGFPVAVKNAFGQFWGVQVGYWSWVGNIMSMAIYPSILLDLFSTHGPLEIVSPTAKYFAKAAIAIVLSGPSLLGTQLVSRTMITLFAIVLICASVYVAWAYARVDSFAELSMVHRTETTYNETKGVVESSGSVDIDWLALLNKLFWNYDGIQMGSVFGGQVLIPARVYPRAISTTIVLTVLVYLLPLPATIGNPFIDWTQFSDGSYGAVAVSIGGDFLRGLMIVVNFATTIGMFVSSMFCGSTEIAGMAQSGMLHKSLGRRNARFTSPHNAVVLTMVLTFVLLALDTDFLIPVTNSFACLVASTIFAAGVQLRRKFPHFPRPATVPGGAGVLAVIAIIPFVTCATIIGKTLTGSALQLLTVVGFVALGLAYSAIERWRGHDESHIVRF
jgi:amino acid transporter